MPTTPNTATPPSPLQPLTGVRVADFSSNMAGPYGAMILAQLGADVIKVEPPQGDDSRAWPPFVEGMSLSHRHMGAGKRGMVIDLKVPEGVAVALALIANCDVVLQSMRPGGADRIGIGQAASRAANPDVLYYDLNAFGSGPTGNAMPGYDPLVQAFTGIMQMTGHAGSPPTRCAPSLIDLGSGQWIAMGVLADDGAAKRCTRRLPRNRVGGHGLQCDSLPGHGSKAVGPAATQGRLGQPYSSALPVLSRA